MSGDLDAICMVRQGNALVPADTHADEFIGAIPDGKEVMVSIRRPRHPEFHRFFWAKLSKIVENSEQWSSPEDLLQDLKLATKHLEKRINAITGEQYVVARSISFANLSQDKFAAFNERCDYVLAQAGIDVPAILNEIGPTPMPPRGRKRAPSRVDPRSERAAAPRE